MVGGPLIEPSTKQKCNPESVVRHLEVVETLINEDIIVFE